MSVPLFIKRVEPTAKLPTKATDCAAGFDLYSVESVVVPKSTFKLVRTGLAMEIPKGYCGYLRPRSGKATREGLVLRSSNVIDSDYRGEVMAGVFALGEDLQILAGERFIQMLILPVPEVRVVEVDIIAPTMRNAGGFGSTGTHEVEKGDNRT